MQRGATELRHLALLVLIFLFISLLPDGITQAGTDDERVVRTLFEAVGKIYTGREGGSRGVCVCQGGMTM